MRRRGLGEWRFSVPRRSSRRCQCLRVKASVRWFPVFAAFVLVTGFSAPTLRAQEPTSECTGAQITVGDSVGRRGDVVSVEVRGEIDCEVSGFIAAIGHDPAQVRFVAAEPGPFIANHAGSELLFRVTEHNDQGYAVVGAIFDFSIPLTVPPVIIGPDTLLSTLTYEILPGAAEGVVPLLNRTRTYGDTNLIANVFAGNRGEFSIDPVLVDGAVMVQADVVPPGGPFKRGDSNTDETIDLSDALFILNFLFSGGDPPTCHKSADANDDGSLDLSDPLSVLGFLFSGSEVLPAPFSACGVDETPDTLPCEGFALCPR